MSTDDKQESAAPGRLVMHDGIAWLFLDDPAKKVNTLSTRMFRWFEEQIRRVEDERPDGLILLSGKPNGFVAGADIEELLGLEGGDEVRAMLMAGHELNGRLDDLPLPTVAAIHGACLGGGLELALACDLRVATEDPKTKLGLPEVQLGLIPGMGGTQRLPRLIGIPDALDLVLTGRQVSARSARRLGLVDEICHPHDLGDAAMRLLDQAGRAAVEKRRHKGRALASRAGNLLARTPLGDRFVYDRARDGVRKKSGGHYPAPLVAVDVIQEGQGLPLRQALELEAGAFSELVVSDIAKNLMSIFFMKNRAEARSAKLAAKARPLGTLGVLGAGFMGSGVAQVLVHKGFQVVMKDKDLAAVGRGLSYAHDRFAELRKRRKYSPVEVKQAMGRLLGTVDYRPLAKVDFVIEAVFEDVGLKQKIIRETEAQGPDDLIFASNTSTIPISRLAEASGKPENVVGMHFFSPVHKMPLLEIIRTEKTSAQTLATTVEVGRRMGKTIIVVNDGPGFFTSRVLGPMLNEAAWLLTEGARIEQIDRAMTRWGWPVGPLALLDEVGLDISAHVSEVMAEYVDERMEKPPIFSALVESGRTGRKGGSGFYLYENGKKKGPDEKVYELVGWQAAKIVDEDIVDRCWLQMLNETARTIEDGVISDPDDIDIGVIFGFGFPPFRGGILRHADRVGLDTVVARLDGFAERHGPRFAPAELLRTMAAKGKRFRAE